MNFFSANQSLIFIPCHCRYIGLPPSWSTSLANAGFTPEEIANIHARRAAGSLTPDLRYLYTDRPTSPQVAGFQITSPTDAPFLPNPASRSASLPLSELRPPPIITASSSFTHRPSPHRKPPLPITEDHLQNGHKPNKSSSSSTALQSIGSHQANLYVPFSSKYSFKQIALHTAPKPHHSRVQTTLFHIATQTYPHLTSRHVACTRPPTNTVKLH